MAKREVRDRGRPLKVYVSAADRVFITSGASQAGMSVSDYLRVLGLHHEPKSVFDQDAVLALAKVSGDVGRLGGLLKWLLSEAPPKDVADRAREVVSEIAPMISLLREKAARV